MVDINMEDPDYIGNYSAALGLTLSKLNDEYNVGIGVKLTNGAVLELRDMVIKLKQPMSLLIRWIIKIFKSNNVDVSNEQSLYGKINGIKKTRQDLKKYKTESVRKKMDAFLSEDFTIPVPQQSKTKGVKRRMNVCCKECAPLHLVNEKLSEEINVLKKRIIEVDDQLKKKPKVVIKKKIGEPRQRLNQTIKRKNITIASLKSKIRVMKRERKMKPAVEEQVLEGKLFTVKKQKRSLTRRSKKTIQNLELEVKKCREVLKSEREKCTKMKEEIDNLNEEVAELTSSLNFIETKKDGKTFNWAVRRAVYFCLEQEVPAANISAVLHHAVAELAGVNIGTLPDAATCLRMLREMRELARMQVSEALQSAKNTTLKYDGTTKKKSHYLEVQVADESKTFTTGISLLPSGTSAANAQGIFNTLNDLGAASKVTVGTDSSQKILDNIANTMTDRCAVNKAVNREIKEAKTEGKQHLNEFFCAMHPLDTFAKSCDKEISTWETENLPEGHKSMSYKRRSLSGAQSLISAVCRLCFNDGSGLPSEVHAFLKDKGIQIGRMLSPVIGNRFHILYRNAGAVYLLIPHLQEFLTKVWLPTNDLHRAVLADSKVAEYQTGCRALGIIGKYISGPWMAFVERDLDILKLNKPFQQAVGKLEEWKLDPSSIVNGSETASLFEDIAVNKDEVFTSLTTSNESDSQVKELLTLLLDVIIQVCKRQLEDQLPGGVHFEPNEELVQQARSCVNNNISGERIFGLLDHYVKRAPNASLSYIESKIIFKTNKTSQWLNSKSKDQRENMLSNARALCLKSLKVDAVRHDSVMEEKKLILKKKREELVERDDRTRMLRENLLSDLMLYGGLWQDKHTMEVKLQQLATKKQKLIALKAQLNVRKKIIEQKANVSLFCFSANGKPHTVEQLMENLEVLMQSNDLPENHQIREVIMNPEVLLGKKISHLWSETGDGLLTDSWYEGTIQDYTISNREYKLIYKTQLDQEYFMDIDEVVADMRSGDLIVEWND